MIGHESLETYLTRVFRVPVDVRAIRRLGGEGQGEDPKPFFAFRALVIAHPRWYPNLADTTRAALLRFARTMAAPTPFDPARVPSLLEKPS